MADPSSLRQFDGLARIVYKDWFDWDHNPSHLTLYPDVLKVKTIIFGEIVFPKMLLVYFVFTNLQIHHLATLLAGCPDYGFVNF